MLRLVYRHLVVDPAQTGLTAAVVVVIPILEGFDEGWVVPLGDAIADTVGTFAIVEAERRLGDGLKFDGELHCFLDADKNDRLLSGFRRDSFITLRLARYL
ncbi:MAG TPA: hypothetical protein PKK10_08100 [Woeseiaceae bacterium]|nr:hypothetical protein [Woeseiaceae bacterium]